MNKSAICILTLAVSLFSGCAKPSVPLAPVEGIITYLGSPLAGATITFIPEKGPIAIGASDMNGRFRMSTGGFPGVVIARCTVGVTVAAPAAEDSSAKAKEAISKAPKNAAEAQNYLNSAGQIQRDQAAANKAKSKSKVEAPKSLIPAKYNQPESSGLIYTIEPGGKKDLKIELN